MAAHAVLLAALAWSPSTQVAVSVTRGRVQPMQMAAPSPPPAVDLRFEGKRPGEDAAGKKKYGHDPRDVDDPIEGDAGWAAGLTSGQISELGNLPQLQGALDAAEADSGLVIIKFMRDGCVACASTQKQYARAAKDYAAKARFFEVNYDNSKSFCRKCEVKFVPSAHIYKGTSFVDALPLGKNSWDKFAARLKEEAA